MKKIFFTLLICFLSFSVFSQVAESKQTFFHGSELYAGIHTEMWNDFQVKQQTWESVLPVYYSMNLDKVTQGLALDAVTSPTLAFQTGDGVNNNVLPRIAGSKVRASYNFKDYFLATTGVQIPTGNSKLSSSEVPVAGAIATPQMAFQVSDVQTGFNWSSSLSSSYQLTDELVVGAGASYLLRGSYIPVDSSGTYKPGDELTLTVGTDYDILFGDMQVKLMGEYMFSWYGTDTYNNSDVYQALIRHTINLRADCKPQNGLRNLAVLSFNIFGKNGLNKLSQYTGKADIFLLSDYVYLRPIAAFSPYVIANVNMFANNNGEGGNAFVGGAGAGCSMEINRALSIRAQLVLQGGALNGYGLVGAELNGGINYVF